MADLNFRFDTVTGGFPLLSTLQGRSVQVPTKEDAYDQVAKPTIVYMENVLPRAQGFSSVGYKYLGGQDESIAFAQVNTYRSCDEHRLHLLTTSDTNSVFVGQDWVDVGGVSGNEHTTFAHIHGDTFICRAYTAVQKLSYPSLVMSPVILGGLELSNILGITNANNFLIAYTGTTIHWSSVLASTDFVPMLGNKAGSIVPNPIRGMIVACLPITMGFLIFTTANIVRATFSNNLDVPFNFTEIENSGGITHPRHVTTNDNYSSFFAWTNKGCQQIDKGSADCKIVYAEVVDFLAGRILEVYIGDTGKFQPYNVSTEWASETQHWADFDTGYSELKQLQLDKALDVRPTLIGSRWLVLSYGRFTNSYTHALVYDIELKRWGKLAFDHLECFELNDADQDGSYRQANHQIGFVDSNQGVWQLDMEGLKGTGTNSEVYHKGVIFFGKVEYLRGKVCTLQSLEAENVLPDSHRLSVMTSLDGKNNNPAEYPFQSIKTKNLSKWLMRYTGKSHTIKLTGTFELVSLVGMLTTGGAR